LQIDDSKLYFLPHVKIMETLPDSELRMTAYVQKTARKSAAA